MVGSGSSICGGSMTTLIIIVEDFVPFFMHLLTVYEYNYTKMQKNKACPNI